MVEPNTGNNFVQLARTFHELPKHALESDEADLSGAFQVGEQLRWTDLTKEYRLVILSEAGSGKTAEIRNIAVNLCTEGKAAFFLRLENIPSDLEDAFEVGSLDTFQTWLASGDEGWLLLDSVDEARLRNPGDFVQAIRKLGRRLIAVLDRTHIVITGRATAWRPKTDLALCIRHFPFTMATTTAIEGGQTDDEEGEDNNSQTVHTKDRAKQNENHIFKIVALDDLSSDQIEVFAGARGISDAKSFLDAVERADAWSFTARPQDLEELTEFWIDQSRIGSRLEIIRNSIDRRLTERDQSRAEARPLAVQRARQAARLIAAAATMGKEPSIRVPDGADNMQGIAIQAILPGTKKTSRHSYRGQYSTRRSTGQFAFTIARFANISQQNGLPICSAVKRRGERLMPFFFGLCMGWTSWSQQCGLFCPGSPSSMRK